ncbi:MAG: outer membrane beta-barrel protein [Bacteroidales bacterium]
MRKVLLLSVIFILFVCSGTFAQGQGRKSGQGPDGQPKGGAIKVKVIDESTSAPVEYANVVAFSAEDSTLVTGGITDSRGVAMIRPMPFGEYYVEIDFIGYLKQTKENIEISKSRRFADLGTVKLPQAAELLDDVEVAADRKHVDYKIDKKVVNVSQDITSAGGNAVDALENVPSIQTDIEGNVQLRGSSSFTVLIDGKPTPLEGSEALQQIPASSIENIEIITNPSAKFDPDGTAGIINIIMKEDEKEGVNGNFNLSYGSFNAFDGDFLVNARTGKFNFFVSGSYNERKRRSESESLRATFSDSVFVNDVDGKNKMNHGGYNARAGMDYYLTDNDVITVSGEYGRRRFERTGVSEYDQYYTSETEVPFDDPEAEHEYYINESGFGVQSDYLSTDINYQHKFNDSGHDLQTYLYYSSVISDESSGFNQEYTNSDFQTLPNLDPVKERALENGRNSRMRAKLDYTLPFSEHGKFEAGYQFRNRVGLTEYEYQIWDQGDYANDSSQFNDIDFNRQVQSAYSTYTNRLAKFDFMLGVRAEYTDRLFTSNVYDQEWKFNKFDIFPSVHVSRKIPWDVQLQASYTRRVRRPRPWFLDPFRSKMDEYSYRQGNPELSPAYIDSYELNAQKRIGKHFIALETFYRKTHEKFERITRTDPDNSNILISSFENVGSDESYGMELMSNFNFFDWWNFNLTADVYQYSLDAMVDDVSSQKSTITYSGRMNNTFKIKKTNTRFQLFSMYRSPSVTAQGERGSFFMVNAAVKQSFLDRALNVTFSVNDVLGTMGHERESYTDNFYMASSFDMISPLFKISVSYILNDYERRNEEHESVEIESGEGM